MVSPTMVPRTVPSSVASGATIKMSRDPVRTREKMSRPSWSVPKICALDGGLLMANRFCAFGSCGAIELPKIAHTIHHSRISAPTMKSGERTSSRNVSRRTSLRPADSAAADSTGTAPMLIPPPSTGSAG